MIFLRWACAALLAPLLFLAGCGALPVGEKIERAAPFELMGRVLVRQEGRAFSANVRWVHAQDSDELWLLTPTGQGLAQLREDATGATLIGVNQTVIRGTSIESLTRQGLGWSLPVTRMQHWVRGAPAPGAAFVINERDAAGKVRLLTQDGWRVNVEHYPADTQNGLPRRMELVGAAQTIRLVIDTWGRSEATEATEAAKATGAANATTETKAE